MNTYHPGQVLCFTYTNHRKETAARRVIFHALDFGHNEWYEKPQWFMRCLDLERNVILSFAFNNIVGEVLVV